MNITGSGSGSGMLPEFSCTDPSTFSSDSISNHTHWELFSDISRYFAIPCAIILGIMNLLAFGWNLFILVVYCYKYYLLKHSANIFLFSLALLDFLMSVTVLPASVLTFAANEYIIGSTDQVRCGFCYFHGFLLMFSPTISLTILAMLSMDRCFLLSNPLVYKKREKPLLTAVIVVIVWIFCILLCALPAFGFGEWEFNRSIAICSARYTPNDNLYFMFLLIMYSLIPIVILGVTNIWTFRIVKKFLRNKLIRRRSYRGSIKEKKEDNSRHQQQQAQLIKVFGALFIANTVIWAPLIVMAMVVFAIGGDRVPAWPFAIFWLVVASNNVVHPILESFFNKELRLAFNKSKRRLSTSVRTTSRTLIRRLTNQSSFKDIPDDSEFERRRVGSTSTAITNTGRSVSEFSSTGQNFTIETNTPESIAKNSPRTRKTGLANSPPPLSTHSSSVFDYPSNSNKNSVMSPRSTSVVNSPSPLLTDRSTSPKPPTTPVTPLTPGKRRTVSITLPDDDKVYYPFKHQHAIDQHSPPIHEDTVFEEEDEVDSDYETSDQHNNVASTSSTEENNKSDDHSSNEDDQSNNEHDSVNHTSSTTTTNEIQVNGIQLQDLLNNNELTTSEINEELDNDEDTADSLV